MNRRVVVAGLLLLLGQTGSLAAPEGPRADYNARWKKRYEDHQRFVQTYGKDGEVYVGDFDGLRKVDDQETVLISRFDAPIEIFVVIGLSEFDINDSFGVIILQERTGTTGFGERGQKVEVSSLGFDKYIKVLFDSYQKFHKGEEFQTDEYLDLRDRFHTTFKKGDLMVRSADHLESFLFDETVVPSNDASGATSIGDSSEKIDKRTLRQVNLIRYVNEKAGSNPVEETAHPFLGTGKFQAVVNRVGFGVRAINVEFKPIRFFLELKG